MIMKSKVFYFEKKGKENTETAIKLAIQRGKELGIKSFVMSSTYGYTAETFLKLAKKKYNAIVITHQAGFREKGKIEMKDKTKNNLINAGMKIVTTTHAFSGIERGISREFGGITSPEIIANTLRLFSQGMKVCVEITVMASDAGLIDMNKEVIAIGGTDRGADTVAVIKPMHSTSFFDLDIKEIVAIPRDK